MRKNIYFVIFIILALLPIKGLSQGQCPYLFCIPDIQVSVGSNCQALIIPEYVLPPDTCTHLNYQINIYDELGTPVPNPVTQEYLYTDLLIEFIDLNLNKACTTNVIVVDKLPPVINSITGPGIISCLSNLEEVFTVDAEDNCDFIVEISDISLSCTNCSVITAEITWTATDIGNNTDSKTIIRDLVGFWDNIIWPADYIVQCEADLINAPIPVINYIPGCDREYTIEHVDYTSGCTINRVWTIVDEGSGLQTSHTQTLLINNVVAPVIIAPDEVYITLEDYNNGWELEYDVFDDCIEDPEVYVSWDIFSVSCDPEYFKVIYTIEATDDCDNTSTHATVVHVTSSRKPKVSLSGKKSCYFPFIIYTEVRNMALPVQYDYSINNITWSVTDLGEGRARVVPGIGKATIQVEVKDQAYCVDYDVIKFNCNKVSVYKKNTANSQFEIYPNPTSGKMYISDSDFKTISIFDIKGKLMDQIFPSTSRDIDVSKLSPGIYMLRVQTDTETRTLKIIRI